MEYNYTKEFKQPHKIYSIKGYSIPYFSDGLRIEYIFVFALLLVAFVLIWGVSALLGFDFITYLVMHDYLLVGLGLGVVVWLLFTLKWDHKSFSSFLYWRLKYTTNKAKKYEHNSEVTLTEGAYSYQTFKQKKIF
ncbi:TcpE family conjugal transfer membrane protein [Enterococcus faecium]